MANFISKSFTESLNLIPLCKYNGPVKSLDGRPMTTDSSLVYYLQCNVQGTSFQGFFIGTPTGGYEIVLGMPWFQKTNPRVDWAQHKVYLQKDMGTEHKIQEKAPLFNKIKTHKVLSHQEKEPQEPCCHLHRFYTYRHPKLLKQTLLRRWTKQSLRYHLNQGTDPSTLFYSTQTKTNYCTPEPTLEVPYLYQEYADVFDTNTTQQLPPHRGQLDHAINLIDGQIPPCRPAYRHSKKEL